MTSVNMRPYSSSIGLSLARLATSPTKSFGMQIVELNASMPSGMSLRLRQPGLSDSRIAANKDVRTTRAHSLSLESPLAYAVLVFPSSKKFKAHPVEGATTLVNLDCNIRQNFTSSNVCVYVPQEPSVAKAVAAFMPRSNFGWVFRTASEICSCKSARRWRSPNKTNRIGPVVLASFATSRFWRKEESSTSNSAPMTDTLLRLGSLHCPMNVPSNHCPP
mmetsp:Transcript_121252/g.343127  ORF Transcript_121252/g.343127 Transcript_121252/m.343127 type:complete len:219 (+) Transcript_121252:1145-1801(+)